MTQKKSSSLSARQSHSRGREFENHVTSTLEAQDKALERLAEKLERPALNGGFDDLVRKVDKIDGVAEQLKTDQAATGKKIDAIHVAIYDPDTGLYGRVKEHSQVITRAGKGLTWFIGIVVAAAMTGVGKIVYDFFAGRLHFTP